MSGSVQGAVIADIVPGQQAEGVARTTTEAIGCTIVTEVLAGLPVNAEFPYS